MNVLQVIHGYPPYYMAGSEVYTYNLVRALANHCDVSVFTRIENPFEPIYSCEDSVEGSIQIRRVNNPERDYTLADKYLNPEIDRLFRDYMEIVKPDIVHIGHLSHLSTNIVTIAKEEFHTPVVYTLHDFWLHCFRGQLITPTKTLCQGPDLNACMGCIRQKFKTSESQESFESYRKHMLAVIDLIDLFIAPSLHIQDFFRKHGVPDERIVHARYGFESDLVKPHKKVFSKDSPVTFGFMGRVIPAKGVDILIKAFTAVSNERARLLVFGSAGSAASFLQRLGNNRVRFMGGYDNRDIDKTLSEIDVLVAPSIWYEVSPLVIQEAFLAGIPVITTGIGGMAELVTDSVNGFTVPLGDQNALEAVMKSIIENPEILNRIKPSRDSVVPIEKHGDVIRSIYWRVLDGML